MTCVVWLAAILAAVTATVVSAQDGIRKEAVRFKPGASSATGK